MILSAILYFSGIYTPRAGAAAEVPTDANLKVAFIGDTGNGVDFQNVLNLIKSEGANMVVHQGDFDYLNDADGFFATIDSILGQSFPYFASVGNHDIDSWSTGCADTDGCYAQFLKDRMARIGVVPDDPNLNDQMYSATYRGLKMVFVGQDGVNAGDNTYAPYIQSQLSSDDHTWKICSWHKNQNAMQVGGKADEMGWNSYESCKDLGAIIATAHEHSYSRTKSLSSMQNQIVDQDWPSPNNLRVDPGSSLVFVSGLGGKSIRDQERCLPTVYPYGCNGEWANIYTTNQAAQYGVLFITFNVNGDPNKAHGYFKNVLGSVIDEFDINTNVVVASPSPSPTPTPTPTPTPSPSPTPTPTPTPTSCTAPTIISNSDTNPSRGGTVSFAWNPVSGASNYRVQRQKSDGTWSTRTTTSSTSFTGSDLPNDPNWSVFVYSGTCSPLPGPSIVFNP